MEGHANRSTAQISGVAESKCSVKRKAPDFVRSRALSGKDYNRLCQSRAHQEETTMNVHHDSQMEFQNASREYRVGQPGESAKA